MSMKQFYDFWYEDEIADYLKLYPVLILFKIHSTIRSAEILIHGALNEAQKYALKTAITSKFGGNNLTKQYCDDINDFAQDWYRRNVKKSKVRVINIRKK